jgi:hypothetical protein
MILLDSLLTGGLRFVLDKIATAVDSEMNDEGTLREDLLAAQMQLELGEISEEDFAVFERDLLARLRELRADQGAQGAVSLADRPFEVQVDFGGDEGEGDPRRGR